MNEDPPGDSNEDFQWKCRIGEMKPAVIVTGKNLQEQGKRALALDKELSLRTVAGPSLVEKHEKLNK